MRGTIPSPTLKTTLFELIYILVNYVVRHSNPYLQTIYNVSYTNLRFCYNLFFIFKL
jgi:hypothetical protein